MPHTVVPRRTGRQLQQRGPQACGQLAAKLLVVVLAHLELDDHPVGAERRPPEAAQQDRLAHATQAADDHRLFGHASVDPPEEKVEGLQLIVTSDKDLRFCPRVGCVGVADRIQGRDFSHVSRVYPG